MVQLSRRDWLAGAGALGVLGPRAALGRGRGRSALAARAQRLAARAMEQEGSSCILIQLGDEIVAEQYAGVTVHTPLMAMSISKSVTALAVGHLVDQGLLVLDEPLSREHVPEWAGTDKADVTLRHLLTHTSGLDTARYASTSEEMRTHSIADSLSAVARTTTAPTFTYNNNAIDILGVICQRADPEGLPMDDQLRLGALGAVGAGSAIWKKDRDGNPLASGGLLIRPRDLLKIGTFVRDGGIAGGRRLLSEAWMTGMVTPSTRPNHGWLWWLDRPIVGAPPASWRADGYLGQMVIVVPELDAVVVRMRDPRVTSWDPDERGYPTLPAEVLAWLGSQDHR